jgi:hypothetical protein
MQTAFPADTNPDCAVEVEPAVVVVDFFEESELEPPHADRATAHRTIRGSFRTCGKVQRLRLSLR